MLKQLTAAIAAFAVIGASASATTFVFKGDGLNAMPNGVADMDFETNCASSGDFCSIDHEDGLNYTLDGINLQVRAYAGGMIEGMGDQRTLLHIGEFTRLIQDVNPSDSGLGAFSENNSRDDQTQFDARESIEFIFEDEFLITDVEFNAGGDTNCTNTADGSGEGVCGEFLLQIFDIDDMLTASTIIDITNIDVLAVLGTGARFVLTALTPGGGFSVAQLTVNEVPVPGAMLLLISGIAGLRFASRKQKAA